MGASQALRNSAFDTIPLTGGCGAELLNIDLSQPQATQTWKEIEDAFHQYGVIFFRDQKLTPRQQLDFAAKFGDVSANPLIAGIDGFAELGEVRKEEDQLEAAGNGWHTDQSAREHPVRGTLLLAREIPPKGGDTCFISMVKAYEALSDGLKRTLEGLRAVHSEEKTYAKFKGGNNNLINMDKPPVEVVHPVVIKLPEDGRKTLYVNPGKTIRFEGWTREESDSLLKYLYQHAQKPEFFCRFRWREGSMAFWDNYQTWHYAVNDYHGHRRVMHRTTVVAEKFG